MGAGACNGICNHAYEKKQKEKGMYEKGYIFCASCVFFTKTNDIKCRCCKLQFRKTPRGPSRRKLVELSIRVS